jgi:hypothetical protein
MSNKLKKMKKIFLPLLLLSGTIIFAQNVQVQLSFQRLPGRRDVRWFKLMINGMDTTGTTATEIWMYTMIIMEKDMIRIQIGIEGCAL